MLPHSHATIGPIGIGWAFCVFPPKSTCLNSPTLRTYLIFHTTFSTDQVAHEHSVKIWGFRGPLGAFVAAWGGFCMLTSAPFDNWWPNSFGPKLCERQGRADHG